MRPLPAQAYKIASWLRAALNVDHHVKVKGDHYSALVALVEQRVDGCLSEHSVELLPRGERIAMHVRSRRNCGPTTIREHRPKSHREHLDWPPGRIKRWPPREVRPLTGEMLTMVLDWHEYPQEHYWSCLGHHPPYKALRR